MSNYKQNVVSSTVWPWQSVVEPNNGSNKERITMAAVQVACMVAIGLLLYYFGKSIMSGIVFCIAGVVLFCGLFIPSAFHAIEKMGKKIGLWVATGLTWILLVPFFYICFVPARLILAVRGKDPLTRKFEKEAASY